MKQHILKMPSCKHCGKYYQTFGHCYNHENFLCGVGQLVRLRQERIEKEKLEHKIRKDEEEKLKNQKNELQLAFAKAQLYEKEQQRLQVTERLEKIENLLVLGHEKLDTHSQKLDEIAEQQMMQQIDNHFTISYGVFIDALKLYIQNCKTQNKICCLDEFQQLLIKADWKYMELFDFMRTNRFILKPEMTNEQEREFFRKNKDSINQKFNEKIYEIMDVYRKNFLTN